jgi:hypothetical protein
VKSDWDAWNARPLAEEPVVRLILDGTDCADIRAVGDSCTCRHVTASFLALADDGISP